MRTRRVGGRPERRVRVCVRSPRLSWHRVWRTGGRCYHLMKPAMKVDHWIGTMYAIMNTFSELQKLGVDIGALGDACDQGE